MVNDAQDSPQSGRFVGSEHRFACRVYYEDTDATGVVYHASYIRFIERARSDMLRIAGIDQRAAHERGDGAYAVTNLSIRYRRPAKLDDDLLIRSRVTQAQAASVYIHQKVMRADELRAEADVQAAFVSPDGRPRRQPSQWIDIFRNLTGAE